LKDLNVKFPYIVMAQSIQETGHWKSGIFLENHNLFGMKEAQRRITTAEGTNRNHAYYNHWRESVYDYAFYQCRYLNGIHTESDYFTYLGASYAEDSSYVERLKKVIEKEGLKELFK
jgi:flagellum-specific peptidoglycan hydrolase FlgJ